MKKAEQLFKILTENYKKVIPEKYAKVILQIATLEERINALTSFGMTDKSKEINNSLIELLAALKKDYEDENK